MTTATRIRTSTWARAGRLILAGFTAGAVASVTLAGLVAGAGPTVTDDLYPLYATCMRGTVGTPDAAEHYVESCTTRAAASRALYDSCLAGAPRTPDALDRWTGPCAVDALGGQKVGGD